MPIESTRSLPIVVAQPGGRHILEVGIPSQAQPEQTVRRAEASIRTGEDTQLVAQGKMLEKQVSTRGQGRSERRDRPEGVTHRL
jgi:hypothetical protein